MDVRHRQKLAVLFIDLDNFKSVNDTYGHTIGDALLRAVAKLLCEVLRDEDTVSRYGGDEFLVLLPEIDGARDAITVASKILLRFATPLTIDGQLVHLEASIGICIYPDHGEDGTALIRAADLAMYEAKKGGGNRYRISP
jgi:diguanylate cyclase (GGDEF)-like protein